MLHANDLGHYIQKCEQGKGMSLSYSQIFHLLTRSFRKRFVPVKRLRATNPKTHNTVQAWSFPWDGPSHPSAVERRTLQTKQDLNAN